MQSILRSIVVVVCFSATSVSAQTQVSTSDLDGLRPRSIGPANMSGRLVDIAVVEADTKVFYIASATGGVWKTTDNGIRFEPVFEREGTHSVGDVAVHRVDGDMVNNYYIAKRA